MSSNTPSVSQSIIQSQIEALGKDFFKRELPDGPTADLEWIDVAALPVAQRMAVQEQARNPVLMMIEWLWNAVCSWISNQFHAGRNQYNRDLMFLCHCLKNQGHISFQQFLELNDCVNSRDTFSRKVESLINELYKNRFIDKRGRRHLIALLAKNELKEALLYLNTVSVLNTLNANIEDVKQVINPREALQVSHELRMAFENSIFDPKASAHLHSILARVQIARWIEGVHAPAEIKEALLASVKKGDRKEFAHEAKELLMKLSETSRGSKLHAYYYQDLAKSFDQPIHEDPFLHFAHGLTTEGIVASWQKNFEELSHSIGHATEEEIEAIKPQLKRLYAIFGHMLHQEQKFTISDTAYSHVYGILRQQWEKINDAISIDDPEGNRHLVCGCNHHTDSTGVGPWPDTATTVIRPGNYASSTHRTQHPKLKAVITTCSWGAGHQSAAAAVRDYLGKNGFHTTAIDVPQEVLLSEDTVNNIFGGDYSITKLYNTIVAGEHFGFLDFLTHFAGDPTQQSIPSEVEKQLIRNRVLKERPDILISVYPKQTHILAEVAEELGIPLLFVNTDLDCDVSSNARGAEYPHFTVIVPNADPEVMTTASKTIPMDRIKPLGYPVRPEFMTPSSEEALAELRQELGVEDDEKIVLVMNGGCGSNSPWTEEVVKALKQGQLEKCHVVSVCGRNQALKEELEKLRTSYPELAGKIHIKGYVNADEMALLMNAAKTIITKPGGATTAEAIQTKTKLVMFHLNGGVPWEKFTSDWIVSHNMGGCFRSKQDFLPVLKAQLEGEFPDQPELTRHETQEAAYVNLAHEMIGRVLTDPECMQKQRAWRCDVELPAMRPLSAEGRRLASSQLALKSQLSRISDSFRLSIPDETLSGLKQGKAVVINHQTGQLELSDEYNEKEMAYVMQRLNGLFTDWENNDEDISSTTHKNILQAATLILERSKSQYGTKIDQGLTSANRKDPHLMQIANLDRLPCCNETP